MFGFPERFLHGRSKDISGIRMNRPAQNELILTSSFNLWLLSRNLFVMLARFSILSKCLVMQ